MNDLRPLPYDIHAAAGDDAAAEPEQCATVSDAERAACHDLLREIGWGVLSVIDDGTRHPYAVPVAYAFDGQAIYVATGRGRKLRALERNPALCLTVLRVDCFDRWRSVVITGTSRWLTGAASRATAASAFLRQHRRGGHRLGALEVRRLLGARVFRIDVLEMSTRSQGTLIPDAGRDDR